MSSIRPELTDARNEIAQNLRSAAGWLIFAGVLAVIFGAVCVAAPMFPGIAIIWLVGGLMLVGGLLELTQGIKLAKGTTGRGWIIFAGILAMFAGGYLLANPLFGLLAVTWVLTAYFVVSGILRCVAAFALKPAAGWGWVLFSGVMTVLLGAMVFANWPLTGAWLIGTIFGIHLIFAGWEKIMIGIAARSIPAKKA